MRRLRQKELGYTVWCRQKTPLTETSVEVGLGLRALAEDQEQDRRGNTMKVWATRPHLARILGYPATALRGMRNRSQRCVARSQASLTSGEPLCGCHG